MSGGVEVRLYEEQLMIRSGRQDVNNLEHRLTTIVHVHLYRIRIAWP